MYLVKLAMKQHVDALLSKQTFLTGVKMEQNRAATVFPSVVYLWDEFAEEDDSIQNGLLTIRINTKRSIDEVPHNKLVQYLKRSMNKQSFTYTKDDEKIDGRFIFNSISDTSEFADAIQTSLIFDVRSFIEEKCCN